MQETVEKDLTPRRKDAKEEANHREHRVHRVKIITHNNLRDLCELCGYYSSSCVRCNFIINIKRKLCLV